MFTLADNDNGTRCDDQQTQFIHVHMAKISSKRGDNASYKSSKNENFKFRCW